VTAFVGFLIVSAVAVAIALPLLRPGPWVQEVVETAGVRERLRREKNVALIAIKEAEFDRAMGKLSAEDYAILKGDYEERALDAIEKLSKDSDSPATTAADSKLARYCVHCGSEFPSTAAFCSGCGAARAALPAT
jgi:hypothetical protein